MSLYLDILIVEDEREIAELMQDTLHDENFSTRIAKDSTTAFEAIHKKVPNLIILDIWLQNSPLDGIGILEQVKAKYKLMPVIMISGHGTIENVVHAIKVGAYDYITKPFSQEKLILTVKRAYEAAQLKKENKTLKNKIENKQVLIGTSDATLKLNQDIQKIPTNVKSVLLIGDHGTEKENVAKILHKNIAVANRPFLHLHITNLEKNEIEKMLFGYPEEKQEVFVLTKTHKTLIEQANDGTIYIDNLAYLSLSCQKRLLRFIQSGINENNNQKVNIKIIVGTSMKSLQEMQTNQLLDEHLYKKLQTNKIKIPNLSDRKDDIEELCSYHLKKLCALYNVREITLSDTVMQTFKQYSWPLNLAEIKHTLEWIVMNSKLCTIKFNVVTDLVLHNMVENCMQAIKQIYNKSKYGQFSINASNTTNNIDTNLSLKEARSSFEKYYLSEQMKRMNNNISKTAKFIGMERSALHRKLISLGIYNNLKDKAKGIDYL